MFKAFLLLGEPAVGTKLTAAALGFAHAQSGLNGAECMDECADFYKLVQNSRTCRGAPKGLACQKEACTVVETFDTCFPCIGLTQTEIEQAKQYCYDLQGGGAGGGVGSSGGGGGMSSTRPSQTTAPGPIASGGFPCASECSAVRDVSLRDPECISSLDSPACYRQQCSADGFEACMLCNGASQSQATGMRQQCSVTGGTSTTGGDRPDNWVGDGCDLACRDLHGILNTSSWCRSDAKSIGCLQDVCAVASTFDACYTCLGQPQADIDGLKAACYVEVSGSGFPDLSTTSTGMPSSTSSGGPITRVPGSTIPFGPVSGDGTTADASTSASTSATAAAPSATSPSSAPPPGPAPSSNDARRHSPVAAVLLSGALMTVLF